MPSVLASTRPVIAVPKRLPQMIPRPGVWLMFPLASIPKPVDAAPVRVTRLAPRMMFVVAVWSPRLSAEPPPPLRVAGSGPSLRVPEASARTMRSVPPPWASASTSTSPPAKNRTTGLEPLMLPQSADPQGLPQIENRSVLLSVT